MDGLTLERLQRDMTDFEVLHSETYEKSYRELMLFFQGVTDFEEKHLILFAQLIYGSMPTMVNINLDNSDMLLNLLYKVSKGSILNIYEIGVIKGYINNSLVGASKLLHFLNPKVYAIWDSRIYRYITGKSTSYGIGKIGTYLEYLDGIKTISEDKQYPRLHHNIAKHFDYEIQPSRVMEIIMFQTDRLSKK